MRSSGSYLPGKGFFLNTDTEFFFALFQDAGKLVQVRGVLLPDGRSEFCIKLFSERDFLIADLV